MNFKNLIGKTVVVNYYGEHMTGPVINTYGDGFDMLRLDNEGWESLEYVEQAKKLGIEIPNKPRFWFIASAHLVVGVVTPLSEFTQAEPESPVAIPSTPIEPTAPMTAQVLQMLRKKGDVTSIEASGVLRCRSLSKRITELKRLGHNITRTLHEDHTGQRYARYILAA